MTVESKETNNFLTNIDGEKITTQGSIHALSGAMPKMSTLTSGVTSMSSPSSPWVYSPSAKDAIASAAKVPSSGATTISPAPFAPSGRTMPAGSKGSHQQPGKQTHIGGKGAR